MANAAFFTIFVDRFGGDGYYRDFATRAAALRHHSRECKNPATERSLVKEYSKDDPEFCKVWADFRCSEKAKPLNKNRAA